MLLILSVAFSIVACQHAIDKKMLLGEWKGAQCRSRLVHDQNAGILCQRFGNLDNLLLTDAQIAHQIIGLDRLAQALQECAGALALGAGVDHNACLRHLACHEDIFGHAQVWEEVHLLNICADEEGTLTRLGCWLGEFL